MKSEFSSADGWCKVEYGGNIGYVKDQYLNFTKLEATKAPSAPAVPKPESGKGRVRVAVKFRKEPKAGAVSLGRLYPGYEVDVVSTTNGWCKCTYKGATGYIKSDYLDITPIPTPEVKALLTPEDLTFRGTSTAKYAIRFRNDALDGAESKYTIYQGNKFFVLKKLGAEWALCEYKGIQGYVRLKHIQLNKEAFKPLTEDTGAPIKIVTVNAKNAHLKIGPGYDYETTRTLALNEKPKVYEEVGDWYRVITEKGEGGYIPKSSAS